MHPDKDIYINKERTRWASYFSVPIIEHVPEGFPPMTLGVQRALCAVSQLFPEKLAQALEELFSAFWIEGNINVGKPEVFDPILERVLGKKEKDQVTVAVCERSPPNQVQYLLTDNAVSAAANKGPFGFQH